MEVANEELDSVLSLFRLWYAGYTIPQFYIQWCEIITKDKFGPHIYVHLKVILYILLVSRELIFHSWSLGSIYLPAYLVIISC